MRVLVAGWIGSTNLGDELVFAGLRRLLAERDVEVVAISRDPALTRRDHGVEAVGGDPAAVFRAVGSADAVVFGGGGLLQDITSPLNLPYHLSRVVMAGLRGRPFAGVGLGVGGLETKLGWWQVRRTMRRAVGVSVRDAESRDLLAAVGVPGAHLSADLALALGPTPGTPVAAPAGPGHVAVCLRPWGGGRTRLPAQARGDATPQVYVEVLAAALDRIAADTGLGIRLVGFQRDRDDALHARIAGQMSTPTTRCTPPLHGVLEEVAAATSVVSMRYHGGIAAVLAGRPVVLIDYAHKVASLAGELGAASRLLAWDLDHLATLPEALQGVADAQAATLATRDRLLHRQTGNAVLLDRLLAAT